MVKIPAGYILRWEAVQAIPSQSYTCAFCGRPLASEKGWLARSSYSNDIAGYVCICHFCQRPTYIDEDQKQHPGVAYGNSVSGITDSGVETLYEEARRAYSASAFTAAVLACRKLLMHIAVSKGAAPGEKFIKYVEYLAKNNYVPPDARSWVDHIRTKSNEANHEIVLMAAEDAEELLAFSEMLLKVIFEFPAAVKRRTTPPKGAAT
jgi:hypothetical protein